MEGTCPRCGGASGDSRWCPTCGKKLGGGPTLPTPEAAEAARRETAWLEKQRDAEAAPAPPYGPGFAPPGPTPVPYGPGPVAPPYGPGPVAPPYGPGPPPPYGPAPAAPHIHPAAPAPPVDPSGLARVVRLLLYANLLVASVVGILNAVFLRAAGDLISGSGTAEQRDEAGVATVIAYLGQGLLLCVTAGFFIAWLHRVYRNTRGLGADELRYSEGWAVGGWFVPVMNFWRPKEILNDAWRASDPGLGVYPRRHEWDGAPVPAVFLAWWLTFCVWNVAHWIAFGFWGSADEPEEEQVGAVLAICAEMILIVAALLALRVVTLATARQNERAAEREQAAVPAAQAPV